MKTMKYQLVAILSFALCFVQAQSPKIGDVLNSPDGIPGVVFYVSPDGETYWLAAMNDLSGTYRWGTYGDLTGLENYESTNDAIWYALHYESNGLEATKIIYEAQGYNSNYPASHVNIDSGWHIPSTGQLSKLYAALPYVNHVFVQNGGSAMTYDYYWTSTESNSQQAWTIDFNDDSYNGGFLKEFDKLSMFHVRPIWSKVTNLITVSQIPTPEAICAGNSLNLQTPVTHNATNQGWQIAADEDFTNPIAYNGEDLDISFNGWFLRYFASNDEKTVYSNIVRITIKPAPYVSEIEGEQFIYVNDHGRYTYSIEPVDGAYDYVWLIDNNWLIDNASGSNSCTVNINTVGTGTLTVKVYSECGYIEKKIQIEHSLQPDIVVYPNPTYGDFKLFLYGMDGETLIEIYDAIGQRIARFTENANVSGTLLDYTLKYHACGMYMISASNRYRTVTKKIVKNTR